MDIRPTAVSRTELSHYAALFARCFPRADALGPDYLAWLYADNPAGQVIGFDAWEGDRLAAHYVCVPVDALVDLVPVRVLLSLNTATAPEFQGRGLFTQLAEATYARAADHGIAGIYGIANANSTPGFVRKLGFTLVSPLDARLGFGAISADDGEARSQATSFQRLWTPSAVAWRVANPSRPYAIVRARNGAVAAQASTGKPGLLAWADLPQDGVTNLPVARPSPAMHLHLGLRPTASRGSGWWLDIPRRLRPSPLNLIYRDLRDAGKTLDKGAIHLGLLDFDAF